MVAVVAVILSLIWRRYMVRVVAAVLWPAASAAENVLAGMVGGRRGRRLPPRLRGLAQH
jgi:hypothetical protein